MRAMILIRAVITRTADGTVARTAASDKLKSFVGQGLNFKIGNLETVYLFFVHIYLPF